MACARVAAKHRPSMEALFREYDVPFDRIGSDADSRVQLALGSSGVPETFVIDGQGIIRYQHVGPIAHDQIPMILAVLDNAQ